MKRIAEKCGVMVMVLALIGCEAPASMLALMPSTPLLPNLPSYFPSFDPVECASVSPKALKQVNWARVPQINMRIRNDEFEPMIVQMTQGWPYTFYIRNRDDRSHAFNASRFLKSIAMVRVTVEGKRLDETCVGSIDIPPLATVEMQLVAAKDGHFEFSDDWQRSMPLVGGGGEGVIIIKERRTPRRN